MIKPIGLSTRLVQQFGEVNPHKLHTFPKCYPCIEFYFSCWRLDGYWFNASPRPIWVLLESIARHLFHNSLLQGYYFPSVTVLTIALYAWSKHSAIALSFGSGCNRVPITSVFCTHFQARSITRIRSCSSSRDDYSTTEGAIMLPCDRDSNKGFRNWKAYRPQNCLCGEPPNRISYPSHENSLTESCYTSRCVRVWFVYTHIFHQTFPMLVQQYSRGNHQPFHTSHANYSYMKYITPNQKVNTHIV